MKARLAACMTFATLAFAGMFVHPVSAVRRAVPEPAASVAPATLEAADPQSKGRFKKQGDECVWDANDGGPNQCTPVTRGRFKKGGDDDSCTWDANDSGPDQCTPKQGRWKKGEGEGCYWDAKDSGPNQCNPRRARK